VKSAGSFKKGDPRINRKGRPPTVNSIPDILKKIGEEGGTVDGDTTKLEVIMRQVFKFALEGKPWAVQFIADRTEGKAHQSMTVDTTKPAEIIFEEPKD